VVHHQQKIHRWVQRQAVHCTSCIFIHATAQLPKNIQRFEADATTQLERRQSENAI
jgi:hypothetical protein